MQTRKLTTQRSATLDDIAARAGVHRMAVSVVLNGARSGTRVSEETRRRIVDIAAELNYRPNAIARSLSRQATHIFGFYSGYEYLDARNPFLAEITGGLLDACARYRRDLLLHSVFRGQVIDDIYDELLSGKIDGLVVWAPSDDPLLARLGARSLPVVAISDILPLFPSVALDEASGAKLMVRHLVERGYRSLIYRTCFPLLNSATRRLEGFRQAAAEAGMSLRLVDEKDDFTEDLRMLMKRPAIPPAVVCWNDIAANNFLAFCRRSGVTVPQDLAVTGFDGIESSVEPFLRLTTVRAPWGKVADTAIAFLAGLLEGKEVPMVTLLPVEVIRGETT